jgi:hypothetical protein
MVWFSSTTNQFLIGGLFSTAWIRLSLNYTGKFDQPSVGPTLFLRAKKLLGSWDNVRRQLAAAALQPSG